MTQKPSPVEPGLKYIDEEEIIWAAGLFEGEGCLSYAASKDFWRIAVNMTDLDVVQHYASIFDLKVKGPYSQKNNRGTGVKWKDVYTAQVAARDKVFEIVSAIYPYLGARRREKCDEFLQWYAAKEGMRYD